MENPKQAIDAIVILQNIIDGGKIDRFKFTRQEQITLDYVSEILKEFLKENEN